MEHGSHSLLFNIKTAAVAWCDKKPIYFLTTKYISKPIVTVMHYDAKGHKCMPVTCPALVKACNSCMDGTDRNDQMTKLQQSRRHYKWPRRLMIKFTFCMFINELYHDLVGAQHCMPTPKSTCKSGLNKTQLQNEAMVLLHLPE